MNKVNVHIVAWIKRSAMRRGGIGVGRILHSGKRCAEQTAQVLAAAIMPGDQPESVEGIKPNDDVAAFGEKLDDLHDNTLVAGHIPFMARLVARLITGNDDFGTVDYRPGSVVCLEQQEEGSGYWSGWSVLNCWETSQVILSGTNISSWCKISRCP